MGIQIRLQSSTIRKFKRGLESGIECNRRTNLKDFSGSDILEFCACGTEFILILDLFFTNGLYGSSTNPNAHTAPLCLSFLCVALHELWGFLAGCKGGTVLAGNGGWSQPSSSALPYTFQESIFSIKFPPSSDETEMPYTPVLPD